MTSKEIKLDYWRNVLAIRTKQLDRIKELLSSGTASENDLDEAYLVVLEVEHQINLLEVE